MIVAPADLVPLHATLAICLRAHHHRRLRLPAQLDRLLFFTPRFKHQPCDRWTKGDTVTWRTRAPLTYTHTHPGPSPAGQDATVNSTSVPRQRVRILSQRPCCSWGCITRLPAFAVAEASAPWLLWENGSC
jgi:hypothetical protein